MILRQGDIQSNFLENSGVLIPEVTASPIFQPTKTPGYTANGGEKNGAKVRTHSVPKSKTKLGSTAEKGTAFWPF